MSNSKLEQLFLSVTDGNKDHSKQQPPVHLWSPTFSGDIDIRIDRDGNWFHEGGKMTRLSMVKMFSRILKREGDDYFLVTPVEKWRIQVDVAPFVIVDIEMLEEQGVVGIIAVTNVGQKILLGEGHPLIVNTDKLGNPQPIVEIRDGLYALIHRNVFYELIEYAKTQLIDGRKVLVLESANEAFNLGYID